MRKFWAVCSINGPGMGGTIGAAVSFDGPLTEQTMLAIGESIKNNPAGTQIPVGCSVTVINLIELEG